MKLRQFVVFAALVVSLSSCAYGQFGQRSFEQHTLQSSASGLRRPSLRPEMAAAINSTSVVDVLEYGAIGDGTTDNTAAFQNALNALGAANGGILWVPEGQFLFAGSLVVPEATSIVGTYRSAPSHASFQGAPPTNGTVLLVTANRGNENGPPFITLKRDSALEGVVVYYPQQDPNDLPAPYPFAVALTSDNGAVMNVELLNAFNGISAVQAGRHFISNVQGQPLNIGVFVDEIYDIGRIENVHFNPWWSGNPKFMYWQLTQGRAFVFGRSDWEYVLNTFAFGYAIGYHFIEGKTGSCNGNFLGIGADLAINASVQVEAVQPPGLLITNGEFTSFIDAHFCPTCVANSTQVVVKEKPGGPVLFSNCAFWGPSVQIANLQGDDVVSFQSCNFVQWDHAQQNMPAIESVSGSLMVNGCTFRQASSPQVRLHSAVKRAVIVGNIFAGKEDIIDDGAQEVQKGLNAGS